MYDAVNGDFEMQNKKPRPQFWIYFDPKRSVWVTCVYFIYLFFFFVTDSHGTKLPPGETFGY
jgi:hypothetical protein